MNIGRTFLQQPELDNSRHAEPYKRYAEEEVAVTKAGLIAHLKEQGEIIDQLTKSVQVLEDHLAPISVSHPMRSNKDHDMNGDSEVVNAIRIHNHLLIMLIDRIADLRSHIQI
jgi:uncharacterized membrane-anchored protein YhcB (DUF1043 family)